MAQNLYKDLNIKYRYEGKRAMDNKVAMEMQYDFIEKYKKINPNYSK